MQKAQAAFPLPAPHSMICPETFAGDRGLQSLGIANNRAVSNAGSDDDASSRLVLLKCKLLRSRPEEGHSGDVLQVVSLSGGGIKIGKKYPSANL
jgi:hypothetical protein